jgi:hypothetical protein
MTCKDCVHYEVCDPYVSPNECFPEVGGCKCFKPKSRFVELPCEVGQTVYYPYDYGNKVLEKTVKKIVIEHENKWVDVGVSFIPFENIGKTVFLSREEAAKALAERSNT